MTLILVRRPNGKYQINANGNFVLAPCPCDCGGGCVDIPCLLDNGIHCCVPKTLYWVFSTTCGCISSTPIAMTYLGQVIRGTDTLHLWKGFATDNCVDYVEFYCNQSSNVIGFHYECKNGLGTSGDNVSSFTCKPFSATKTLFGVCQGCNIGMDPINVTVTE